jgi:hypothetical protein
MAAFATSYIPTTTATVTRSADVASITGTNFSSWYRQDEGTFFVRGATAAASTNLQFMQVDDGTSNERMMLRRIGSSDQGSFLVLDNSVNQAVFNVGTFPANSYRNLASYYQLNSVNVACGGVLSTADTSATIPTVDRLNIGGASVAPIPPNACISRLTYWPRNLGDSVLQTLTQ